MRQVWKHPNGVIYSLLLFFNLLLFNTFNTFFIDVFFFTSSVHSVELPAKEPIRAV